MVLGQLPPRNTAPPPPTPKLTLSQTLTLTGGQFSLGAIVWLPPTLKLTIVRIPAEICLIAKAKFGDDIRRTAKIKYAIARHQKWVLSEKKYLQLIIEYEKLINEGMLYWRHNVLVSLINNYLSIRTIK